MPSIDINIKIDTTGQLSFVYQEDEPLLDELRESGEVTTTRASHVEPDGNGGRHADMAPVGGGVLMGFTKRSEALNAEVNWLQEHLFSCE